MNGDEILAWATFAGSLAAAGVGLPIFLRKLAEAREREMAALMHKFGQPTPDPDQYDAWWGRLSSLLLACTILALSAGFVGYLTVPGLGWGAAMPATIWFYAWLVSFVMRRRSGEPITDLYDPEGT